MPVFEVIAISGVIILVLSGVALRWFDPDQNLDKFLSAPPELDQEASQSVLNAEVPGPVLGGVVIGCLIVLSIVGCYVYFPPPDETFADMQMVKADALTYASSRDVEHAVTSIARYDDLTRKLQVGYYLRNLTLTEFQQSKAKVLRGRLEQLKDAVEAEQFDRVRDLIPKVSKAQQRLRKAFEDQE